MNAQKDEHIDILDMKGKFYVFLVSKIKIKGEQSKVDLINYFDKNLVIYKEGTPDRPGMGFTVIKNMKFPEEILEDIELMELSNNLIVIEYIQERYSFKKKFNTKTRQIDRIEGKSLSDYKKDYIFIIYPDLLFFKGSKESYRLIWNNFYNIAGKYMQVVRDYEFDSEFFLKLLEKFWFKQNNIEDDFNIDFFRDLSTEGKKDFMGQKIAVRQSYDITKSLPILISFLGNKKPRKGLFDFSLRNNFYSIEMNKNGTLIPRQQLGIFKHTSDNERALYGCYVIFRIIKYYEKWENLPNKEKYINIEFIKSIVDYFKDQDVFLFDKSMDLIQEYSKLRGEF